MTSRRQLAGERRASNSGDLNQTPKSPDRRGKTTTSPAPPPSAAAAAAPTTAQRQKELQLRRESERSCATQQWLRDGNGLVPQGLQADEVAQAAPFKLPTLTTALKDSVQKYEWRRTWLTSGSRNKFGTVAEEQVVVLVDTTFDDPTEVIKTIELAAEEQLGDCSRVALLSFNEHGIRREMDELDVVEVDKTTEKQYRIDAMCQWAHRLRRGREKHRVHGLAGNLARGAVSGAKRLGRNAAAGAKSAADVIADVGKGIAGGGATRKATAAHEFDPHEIDYPNGPDLLAALEAAMDLTDIDGIYVLVGSHPKHALSALLPHIERLLADSTAALHLIDYSVDDPVCSHYLKDVVQKYDNMCDASGVSVCNRYLAYSAADNRQLPGSDDLELIDAEIARAYEALQIVTNRTEQVAEATARNEQTDADAVNLAPGAAEVTQKKQKKPTAKAKRIDPRRLTRTQLLQQAKRSGGHTHLKDQEEAQKLMELQHRGEGPRARDPAGDELTSPQWIQRFGFDKGLTPFQEFRSVAYTCSKPGLYMGRKYKSMGTIEWDDGTTRNIHIDVSQIADYRKRLVKRIKMVNERVAWLGTGTRRIFGNLAGDVITLVIDTSAAVLPYWTLVQSHLRDLFQNHLPHKRWFNVVRYDRQATCFESHVVQVSTKNLSTAWEWITEWEVGKFPQRDLMGAVELATDQLQPQHHGAHHIYLLCAGEPDFARPDCLSPTADSNSRGDPKPILQFVRRMLSDGTTVFNTIAYNCYQSPQSVLLLRRLAKESGGAFRLCVEDGTVHDNLHLEDVSWSTDTVQVLRRSTVGDSGGDDPDRRDRSNHYFEVLEWVRLGKYSDSPGPELGDDRHKICLCDGDDAQLLRVELERAGHFLSVVQNMLDQLPPEFAEIAEKLLSDTPLGAGTALSKTASTSRQATAATMRNEGTVPLDVLLRQATADDAARGRSQRSTSGRTGPMEISATRTSQLRATLTRAPEKGSEKGSPLPVGGSRKKSSTKSVASGGPRKGRYMVSNSTPTGKVQTTLRAEPEIEQGPARPLPKEPTVAATLPKKDVPMSSAKWLRKYGLKALRLDTKSFLRENATKLQTGRDSSKKFGSDTSRRLGPGQWRKYVGSLKDAADRYQRRIRWLSTGTNRVFGCLVEKNVVLAVDTSGSMHPHMQFLREQLGEWLRSTVATSCHTFNVVQFNSRVTSFTGEYKCLIEATEDTCACAAMWVAEFEADGGTDIIGALEESTCNRDVDAVYLLNDGLPDNAPDEVLDVAERMSKERNFRVHTISFNSDSEDAREFLRALASRCGGRYHQFTSTAGLAESEALDVRAEDEERSDDIRLLRSELKRVEAALMLAVAEELAAARSIEDMLSTRAPKAASTPKWIPSSGKLENCDDGSTHNKWGKTSCGTKGRDARRIAETMTTMTTITNEELNDIPESERPSLFAESQRSWAKASQVPRTEPEPTKSSLLLQNVTAQKVFELGGGSAAKVNQTSGSLGASGIIGSDMAATAGPSDDAIDTDDEDMLDYLPIAELYTTAGLEPPAPPKQKDTPTSSGRGAVMMSNTGLISAPKPSDDDKPSKSRVQGSSSGEASTPMHRGLVNGISTQVTPTEVAEYVSRWARIKLDPVQVDMQYDVALKQYSGIAYISFSTRQALLRATRMRAGQSNPTTLYAEAVKDSRDNILTPNRSAWLRRSKRVEQFLRGMRVTSATTSSGAKDKKTAPVAQIGTATVGGDFFTTVPCGRTQTRTAAR